MKRSLFEIAVIHHSVDVEDKEVITTMVIAPEVILSNSEKNARMAARMLAMKEDDLEPEDVDLFEAEYEIFVRPFA